MAAEGAGRVGGTSPPQDGNAGTGPPPGGNGVAHNLGSVTPKGGVGRVAADGAGRVVQARNVMLGKEAKEVRFCFLFIIL